MNKIYKSLRSNALFILIGAGLMVWPISIAAHGWKAPPGAVQTPNPIQYNESSILIGGQIFGARCAGCHGNRGMGDGPIAVQLSPKPANLIKRLNNHSEGDFFWKIANGKGPMPGFKNKLSEKQIWDVINYIQSLSGK